MAQTAVAGAAEEAAEGEKGERWGGNGETQWQHLSRQYDGGHTKQLQCGQLAIRSDTIKPQC